MIKNTKISSTFLAVILVAGTLTAFFPSFMIGTAQADPYYNNNNNYDMDREKKSDKSVSVQSLKCNNINVNVNGLELSVLPPFLGGGDEVAATAAEDSQTNANSFANNNNNEGNSNGGSVINDFRFICINNNNNTVVEAGNETVSTPPVVDPCEECFTKFLSQTQINAIFPIEGSRAASLGNPSNLEELCDFLEGSTDDEKRRAYDALRFVLSDNPSSSEEFGNILNCLEQLGLIINSTP